MNISVHFVCGEVVRILLKLKRKMHLSQGPTLSGTEACIGPLTLMIVSHKSFDTYFGELSSVCNKQGTVIHIIPIYGKTFQTMNCILHNCLVGPSCSDSDLW